MIYPQHVAIIPDGNRTRAREQGVPSIEGHLAGQQNSLVLLEHVFSSTPIEVATFWGLSSENLHKRPAAELDYLFRIYKLALDGADELLERLQVNFTWIGNRTGLPDHLLKALDTLAEKYTFATSKTAIFAINYGGRDEIIRGVRTLAQEAVDLTEVTIDQLSRSMDLGRFPPVELVIRTKGDIATRLSGFLSRWIGYAELYFTSTKFPDFGPAQFDQAVERFDQIAAQRNYGK